MRVTAVAIASEADTLVVVSEMPFHEFGVATARRNRRSCYLPNSLFLHFL
jgi:hypothetical protein